MEILNEGGEGGERGGEERVGIGAYRNVGRGRGRRANRKRRSGGSGGGGSGRGEEGGLMKMLLLLLFEVAVIKGGGGLTARKELTGRGEGSSRGTGRSQRGSSKTLLLGMLRLGRGLKDIKTMRKRLTIGKRTGRTMRRLVVHRIGKEVASRNRERSFGVSAVLDLIVGGGLGHTSRFQTRTFKHFAVGGFASIFALGGQNVGLGMRHSLSLGLIFVRLGQ